MCVCEREKEGGIRFDFYSTSPSDRERKRERERHGSRDIFSQIDTFVVTVLVVVVIMAIAVNISDVLSPGIVGSVCARPVPPCPLFGSCVRHAKPKKFAKGLGERYACVCVYMSAKPGER